MAQDAPATGPVFELGGYGAYMLRRGDGINESGGFSEAANLPYVGATIRAYVPFGSFYLQLDMDAEHGFTALDGNNYLGSVLGGGHLGFQTDHLMVGAFGAYGAGTDAEEGAVTFQTLGGEVLARFGGTALLAQGGYIVSQEDSFETLSNAWYARTVGRQFFGEDRTMLQVEFAIGRGSQDQDYPDDTDLIAFMGWGAGIEHQLATSGPGAFSIFASYAGFRAFEFNEYGPGQTVVDHTFRLGFHFRPGGGTLATAPALDLAPIGHWVIGTTAVD